MKLLEGFAGIPSTALSTKTLTPLSPHSGLPLAYFPAVGTLLTWVPSPLCPSVPVSLPHGLPGTPGAMPWGGRGVTDDVFLSDVVKHATIRSGLIVFLVIRSIY